MFNQSGGKAFAKIANQLRDLGAEKVVYFLPFFWKYAESYLPYYALDLPSKLVPYEAEILRVFESLTDPESRLDYAAFAYHLTCPNPSFTRPVVDDNTYFPRDILHLSTHEVFIDGGAFDGDTLVKFTQKTAGQFDEYVGVEPDPKNLAALENRIQEIRIT